LEKRSIAAARIAGKPVHVIIVDRYDGFVLFAEHLSPSRLIKRIAEPGLISRRDLKNMSRDPLQRTTMAL
jgi:hypothetical protein